MIRTLLEIPGEGYSHPASIKILLAPYGAGILNAMTKQTKAHSPFDDQPPAIPASLLFPPLCRVILQRKMLACLLAARGLS